MTAIGIALDLGLHGTYIMHQLFYCLGANWIQCTGRGLRAAVKTAEPGKQGKHSSPSDGTNSRRNSKDLRTEA
jgi:hypothetical protein